MAHLELAVFLILSIANTANLNIGQLSCQGPDILPSEFHRIKIQRSFKFFSQYPNLKSEFLVRQTGERCHNAWADTLRKKVIISEPVLRDFSLRDLAGIIAHEIAHIEFPENEHWQIDLRGAELTSTNIALHKLNRMLSICLDLKKIKGLSYSILYNLDWEIEDYKFRINKIKSYQSTSSPH